MNPSLEIVKTAVFGPDGERPAFDGGISGPGDTLLAVSSRVTDYVSLCDVGDAAVPPPPPPLPDEVLGLAITGSSSSVLSGLWAAMPALGGMLIVGARRSRRED